MRIAITSEDRGHSARVDFRFGRTKGFVLYDSNTKTWEWFSNDQALDLPQGAGIQAAQQVVDRDVEVVLTGHCGPKAFRTLTAAGVKVVVGITGTVEQAVRQYQARTLQPATAPDVQGHWYP